MEQYRVIRHVAQALGRTLEREVSAAVGRPVPVSYRYDPRLPEGDGALTVVHVELERRGENLEREYERGPDGAEQYRASPLPLRSRYLISAWGPAPEDQELLGAVLRTFHDRPELEPEGEEEASTSYLGRPLLELATLSLEEHRLLAQALGMPLAPSVSYWVGYQIQSGLTTPIKRVRERVIDYRMIDG